MDESAPDLDEASTRHADLRSGRSPWQAGVAPVGRALDASLRCGVLIVGGGITGALAAEHLSERGHDVVLVDRERPGFGSTLASTAMLQWEIDTPLGELAQMIGFERAADVYRRSLAAVSGLSDLVAARGLACAFHPRETIYLSAGDVTARDLLAEHELRRRADLPGEFLERGALMRHCGLDREAAIVSPGSAEADPVCLAQGLMRVAAGRGARFIRDEVLSYDETPGSVAATLATGHVVEAQAIVLATGYVMPDLVHAELHSVASSWAVATRPQVPGLLWPERRLIWEASEDYVYARCTENGRIVLGGEDQEISDPDQREALTEAKVAKLTQKLAALWPKADLTIETTWSGAFGQTEDGLPLIGRIPGHPRLYAAYGYGGNGITFSFMASRLIGALIAGEERRWFQHFAIDRTNPLG